MFKAGIDSKLVGNLSQKRNSHLFAYWESKRVVQREVEECEFRRFMSFTGLDDWLYAEECSTDLCGRMFQGFKAGNLVSCSKLKFKISDSRIPKL